ncbi:retrovirus-related pol polyprotein from transposon TNT 1-94 [Tanacetum coccineum]
MIGIYCFNRCLMNTFVLHHVLFIQFLKLLLQFLAVSTGTSSSISVDQDASSPSTLQTPQESPSHVISTDAEEVDHDIEVAHMDNNPHFGIPIPEPSSEESSSQSYKEALPKSYWIEAMQEELNEFEHLEVWELVPRPDHVMIITLKWIYMVKLNELGGVLKNKARLVVRGYHQEEGIDFEESFHDSKPSISFLHLLLI